MDNFLNLQIDQNFKHFYESSTIKHHCCCGHFQDRLFTLTKMYLMCRIIRGSNLQFESLPHELLFITTLSVDMVKLKRYFGFKMNESVGVICNL